MTIERGDGVGIELTRDTVRGVRLSHEQSAVAAAAEVSLHDADDELFLLDALVRLRGLLGNPTLPTRVAIFPSGASMFRVDVTGRSGPELHGLRLDLERRHGVTATVLVDAGATRWMHVLQWVAPDFRRLEDVAERAGFLDAVIEPSPLSLARVCTAETAVAERVAATGERFVVAFDRSATVAAATIESAGLAPPQLRTAAATNVADGFTGVTAPVDLARHLVTVRDAGTDREVGLQLNGIAYPRFPPADIRSAERQCIALGAAVGAAGLDGRVRPIDVIEAAPRPEWSVPWAIDRVSTLPPLVLQPAPTATQRLTARLVPRRRP